jgi:signal recognition particle receptor subunit beta
VNADPMQRTTETPRQLLGARLENVRQQLLSCGAVMSSLVEPQSRPLVTDALAKIARMTVRIAVVGQIKSGKSTFINAFVRHPRLLPTAVTPWTTAVTNLHFAQATPQDGAVRFSFMDANEWGEIANGAGRFRELTERLVPGFEPRILQSETYALAERARLKLGTEFEQLIGRGHLFKSLHPGLLERYICSGEFGDGNDIGRYSEITRSADLYLPGGPFDFPTTVTDTPGINDPSLVRDEITRRSLGAADAYIIVLTARQPLSAQDVALLRFMRGLNKDRVIVLLNRIDELSDVANELPQVLRFVRERLAEEFPGASIPVVPGSAWWAMQALAFEPQAVAKTLKRPSAAHLFRSGLLRPGDADPKALARPDTQARVSHALHAMSGMPALYDAFEFVTGIASPAFSLSLVARGFADMSRACERAAEAELQLLLADRARRQQAATTASIHNDSPAIHARERELLVAVSSNIDASAKAIGELFVRVIDEEQARLRAALLKLVDAHAARERKVLTDSLARGASTATWTHEGFELRRALADTFRNGFKESSERLLGFNARLIPELFKLLQTVVPAPQIPVPQQQGLSIPVPASLPLSRMLVLDLDRSRWQAFWNRSASAEQAGAKIEALIKAEFSQVADELAASAARTFHDFATTTIGWALGACRNIQQALQRRLDRLMQEDGVQDGLTTRFDERITAQAQRLKDTEALTQYLEYLARDVEQIFRPGGPPK